MIIYMGGRRSGKTTRLLKWWLEDPHNRHIVCSSEQRALHVRHMASEMAANEGIKLDTYTMVFFNNIIAVNPRGAARWEGIMDQKVAIDDLEDVLSILMNHQVEIVSASPEQLEWLR